VTHLIQLKACRWWSTGLVAGGLLCAATPGAFAANTTPKATQAISPQASFNASSEETSAPAFDVASASPEQVYNRAVELYRQGDRTQAAELWSRVVARAPRDVEARARFNLGNCSYSNAVESAQQDIAGALKQLDTAVTHYRDALAVAPNDQDARANLELALRLKEQLRQQQEQQQQQQEQEDQQQNQDQQSQQDQQDQQQQQQGGESSEQQQDGEQNQQDQEEQQGDQQQSQEGESSDSEQQSKGQPSESQSDSPSEEGEQPQENESPSSGQQNEQDSQESQNEQNQQPSSGSSGEPQEHEQEQQPGDQSQQESKSDEQAQQQPQDGQQGDQAEQQDARQRPSASQTGQDDASKADAGNAGDEQDPNDQDLPEGKLSSAGQDANRQAPDARNHQVEGTAEADGEMSKQEAEKLLQAVRDRDLLRRYEQLRREQARQKPVDRDW